MAQQHSPLTDRRRVLAGARILVVEDEGIMAMELHDLLEEQGCKVLGPVPTVQQALALLDRQRPDAALLDVNLRGQLATPIAQRLRSSGIPFVLVTGYGEAQLAEPELRWVRVVPKPVRDAELAEALASALRRNRTTSG